MRKPALPDHLLEVWNAFWELSRGRNYTQGSALGLSITQIEAWFDMHMIYDPVIRLDMYNQIMLMDATWLTEHTEKMEIRMKSLKAKGGRR